MTSLRRHALPAVFVASLLCGGTCQRRIEAPAPTAPVVAPAPLPSSRIDTFVRIPLAELEAQAEAVVPRTFAEEPYRMVIEGTAEEPVVTAGYHVERGALSLESSRRGLLLRTALAYWVRARRHVGPITVPGSCGLDGDPRRHFALAVALDARVDPRWNLQPTLMVRELAATDRCEMTFAEVDVTGRVRTSLVQQLESELPRLRERIRSTVDLRARATEAWTRLAEPFELDPQTFLVMHPEAVALTQPTIEGHFLRVGLSLRARPEVVIGARPAAESRPLPDAGDEVGPPGLELHVPVRIDHAAVARALSEHFRLETGGVRYPATGRRYVRPTHIELFGYGSTVVVRVEFTGYADGVLYLSGTPTLDDATQSLSMPDLEFTVESRSLLLRTAAFLRADDFRADLRERVRIELRAPLEETRLRLTRALRRRIGPVELEGAIDTMRVVAVYADPSAQDVRAVVHATGVVRAHYLGE